jgi:hypothetical protein
MTGKAEDFNERDAANREAAVFFSRFPNRFLCRRGNPPIVLGEPNHDMSVEEDQ